MLGFVQKSFFKAITFFGCNVWNVNPLKCVQMNNQECKIRPKIINANSNELLFYPYSIKVNRCNCNKSSCNNVNDPYSKLWAPNIVKNINIKVFNLMSRTNEARLIK